MVIENRALRSVYMSHGYQTIYNVAVSTSSEITWMDLYIITWIMDPMANIKDNMKCNMLLNIRYDNVI